MVDNEFQEFPSLPATLKRWVEGAREKRASHIIVVRDGWDYDLYPVYVLPGQDPKLIAEKFDGKNMQMIAEVYNMEQDLYAQYIQPVL